MKIQTPKESKHPHFGYYLWTTELRFSHAKKVTKQLLITLNMPTMQQEGDDLPHLLFACSYSENCYWKFFSSFVVVWAFEDSFSLNVQQVCWGPS